MSRKVYLIGEDYDQPTFAYLDEKAAEAKLAELTKPYPCPLCGGTGICGFYEHDQVLMCTTAIGEDLPRVKKNDPIWCYCGGKPRVADWWMNELEITEE